VVDVHKGVSPRKRVGMHTVETIGTALGYAFMALFVIASTWTTNHRVAGGHL
jgi:hypothetical protein